MNLNRILFEELNDLYTNLLMTLSQCHFVNVTSSTTAARGSTGFKLQRRRRCLSCRLLQGEARVIERRHLIFATDQQLMQLAASKSWYVDGTFKLVSCPFQQLLSINAFVRSGDCAKQVPLVFVMMCGRRKRYYKKVNNLLSVTECVMVSLRLESKPSNRFAQRTIELN